MNGTHICTTCRRKISAKVFQKYASRQSILRATFISLSASQTTQTTAEEAARPLASTQPRQKNNGSNAVDKSRWPSNGVISKAPRAKAHGDLLEQLFLDGLNRPSGVGVTTALKPNVASLELYERVEKLMELLNNPGTPILAMWTLFSEICLDSLPRGSQTPYSLHFAAKSLLGKLLTARKQIPVADGVPSVSEIASKYASLGLLQPKGWKPMLETFFLKETAEKLYVEGDNIAEDLLETWRYILSPTNYSHNAPGSIIDIESRAKWQPPTLSPTKVRKAMLERGIEQCFALLLPKYTGKPFFHGLTTNAIITFAMLTDIRLKRPLPCTQNHPFLNTVAEVIVMSQITPGELDQYIRTQNVSYGVDFTDRWTSVVDQARSIAQVANTEFTCRRFMTNREPRVFRTLHRILSRRLAAKDLKTLESLWSDVQSWSMEKHDNGAQSTSSTIELGGLTPSRELCNMFITCFMTLNKERAVDVWNFMIQSGLPPTVTTWHAMLDGCRITKDSESLLAIWSKLIDSDIAPDVRCWTILISGLMFCSDLEGGLRAFAEMRKIWERAAKQHIARVGIPADLKSLGDVDGIVKPTTVIINATIAGLLRNHQTDVASQVLAAGEEMGIIPDNITYNTLLRSLVRNQDDRGLTKLLNQMQEQGIKGDVATFTIVLENALSDIENCSPQELIEEVNNIFTEMDISAIKPNLHTYAAIINGILRGASGPEFMAPVNHVLAHMSKMGIQNSAHIHTMLIEFHFNQDEPNLDAIGQLLNQIIKANGLRDKVFWDRVIEGYCYVGDTVNALQYLLQSKKEGFFPGYYTLDVLIHALMRNDEVELAMELVKNTRIERGGPPDPDTRGVAGQHQFWNSVAEMRLGGDDELV